MDVRNLTGRTALVTGAASGIGRATALEIGRRGGDLFLCDVNEAGLDETARAIHDLGREVLARRVDVADAEQMQGFAEAVHQRVPAVDLLVNNAGVALGGGILDTTLEDWDWIVGINLLGVVHGCHWFVPPMVERGSGHVVIVSSTAGFVGGETLAAYSVTKFAVLGLAESLSDEIAQRGVGVTALCPGIIDTPIIRSSKLRGIWRRPEARERMEQVFRRRGYGPERVARALLRAVQRDRLVAPVTPEAWTLYYLKRLFPGLVHRISRWTAARGRRDIAGID